MNKKIIGSVLLLATAILSGYALTQFLKKAGLDEFDFFDLSEEYEEELF